MDPFLPRSRSRSRRARDDAPLKVATEADTLAGRAAGPSDEEDARVLARPARPARPEESPNPAQAPRAAARDPGREGFLRARADEAEAPDGRTPPPAAEAGTPPVERPAPPPVAAGAHPAPAPYRPQAAKRPAPPVPKRPPIGGCVAAGLAVIAVFFGGFGAWAALAPLSAASHAGGRVVVESNRQVVDNREGGVIQELRARNGDFVEAGEVLVTLAPVQAEAATRSIQARLDDALASQARLQGLLDGAEEPAFPQELAERAAVDPSVERLLRAERANFAQSRESLRLQTAALLQGRREAEARLPGLQASVGSYESQLANLNEQLGMQEELLDEGLTTRTRVLDIQRQVAAVQGQRDLARAELAAAREAVAETDARIEALREDFRSRWSAELASVRPQVEEARQQLRAAVDVQERQRIVSPATGRVVEQQFFTVGATVPPGAPLMYVIPSEDRLTVEAQLDPLDIDVVREGLSAEVMLTAYSQRRTPSLPATVTSVAADVTTDERTGVAYFRTLVEIDPEGMANLAPNVELYPGMPVDVTIKLGERTLIDYLVEPLIGSARRALTEP